MSIVLQRSGIMSILLKFLLLGAVSLFLYVIFVSYAPAPKQHVSVHQNDIMVSINDSLNLKTQLAQTPAERARGLSAHKNLEKDEAMLFIFNEPYRYSFWMKDMDFPIDIIWLNENKQIVSIKESADPSDYPQSYVPENNARYVLETVSGFSEKNNLQRGNQFQWEL